MQSIQTMITNVAQWLLDNSPSSQSEEPDSVSQSLFLAASSAFELSSKTLLKSLSKAFGDFFRSILQQVPKLLAPNGDHVSVTPDYDVLTMSRDYK